MKRQSNVSVINMCTYDHDEISSLLYANKFSGRKLI